MNVLLELMDVSIPVSIQLAAIDVTVTLDMYWILMELTVLVGLLKYT